MVQAQVQTGLRLICLVFLERYWHSICACNKRKFQKRKPILPAKGRTNYIATEGGQTAPVSKKLETNHAVKCVL